MNEREPKPPQQKSCYLKFGSVVQQKTLSQTTQCMVSLYLHLVNFYKEHVGKYNIPCI